MEDSEIFLPLLSAYAYTNICIYTYWDTAMQYMGVHHEQKQKRTKSNLWN